MNTENIYDAVSGVDQQFVSAADDTDAIRLSFKKNRARKTKIIGSVVCCAVLVLAAGWASFQNRFGKTPSVFLNDPTTADHLPTEPNETQSALTQPGVIPQATERLPSEKPQSPEPSSVTSPVVEATTEAPEGAFEKTYYYSLYNSEYSDYISGKVITPDKVGEKIGDATVTAGWKYADGSVPVTEQLRCEITSMRTAARFTGP